MTYTLSFSHINTEGQRIALYVDGQEVTLVVEADSKTATYSNPVVVEFCKVQENDCRIRGVN